MPHSFSRVVLHVIFGTKERRPFIHRDAAPELYRYLGGVLVANKCKPIEIHGMPDHVHLLFELNRTSTVADVVEEIKTSSSKWIKTKGIPDFAWQTGYGAFSVSVSNIDVVRRYIAEQEAHHRKNSFDDEFRAFLDLHGIAWEHRGEEG